MPVQRDIQNIVVLSACQMLYGTGRGLFIVAAPAVALLPGFSPDLALATLPAATVVTGMALSAWVSSIVTRRTGRQRGWRNLGFLAGASTSRSSAIPDPIPRKKNRSTACFRRRNARLDSGSNTMSRLPRHPPRRHGQKIPAVEDNAACTYRQIRRL